MLAFALLFSSYRFWVNSNLLLNQIFLKTLMPKHSYKAPDDSKSLIRKKELLKPIGTIRYKRPPYIRQMKFNEIESMITP